MYDSEKNGTSSGNTKLMITFRHRITKYIPNKYIPIFVFGLVENTYTFTFDS